eukprot:g1377.t1
MLHPEGQKPWPKFYEGVIEEIRQDPASGDKIYLLTFDDGDKQWAWLSAIRFVKHFIVTLKLDQRVQAAAEFVEAAGRSHAVELGLRDNMRIFLDTVRAAFDLPGGSEITLTQSDGKQLSKLSQLLDEEHGATLTVAENPDEAW